MEQIVTLKTGSGCMVRITLDNQSSGLDEGRRRWTFEDPYWRCVDTRELAEPSGSMELKVSGSNPILVREPV
jgi:hypothetical protein